MGLKDKIEQEFSRKFNSIGFIVSEFERAIGNVNSKEELIKRVNEEFEKLEEKIITKVIKDLDQNINDDLLAYLLEDYKGSFTEKFSEEELLYLKDQVERSLMHPEEKKSIIEKIGKDFRGKEFSPDEFDKIFQDMKHPRTTENDSLALDLIKSELAPEFVPLKMEKFKTPTLELEVKTKQNRSIGRRMEELPTIVPRKRGKTI